MGNHFKVKVSNETYTRTRKKSGKKYDQWRFPILLRPMSQKENYMVRETESTSAFDRWLHTDSFSCKIPFSYHSQGADTYELTANKILDLFLKRMSLILK